MQRLRQPAAASRNGIRLFPRLSRRSLLPLIATSCNHGAPLRLHRLLSILATPRGEHGGGRGARPRPGRSRLELERVARRARADERGSATASRYRRRVRRAVVLAREHVGKLVEELAAVRAADSAPALLRAAAALTAASTSPGDAEDTSAKGSPRKGFTAWKTGPEPFALRLGLLTSRTSRWFLSLGFPPTTGASGFSVRQRSESLRRMEYLTMPGWRSRCRLTHPRCAGRSSGGPRSQA